MNRDGELTGVLLSRAADGEAIALEELFDLHRRRLARMIHMRLDTRLRRRVDVDDIVQEVYSEAAERLQKYMRDRSMPFFLWLRFLTNQKLAELHRRHFGAQSRDLRREVHAEPSGNTLSDPRFLADRISDVTSPSGAAAHEELRERLYKALAEIAPTDREVLVLRHFEHLSSAEVAHELGIMVPAAGKRYVRALQRIRAILDTLHDAER